MVGFADALVVERADAVEEFRKAVMIGLAAPQKEIPAKFFYDAEGSRLFDRICELDEYYPTRTEMAILSAEIDAIVGLLPSRPVLVEFGSGASRKVRLLLDTLDRPAGYVPIDISREHLLWAAAGVSPATIRDLPIVPVRADFTRPFRLPRTPARPAAPGLLPGIDHRQLPSRRSHPHPGRVRPAARCRTAGC